VHHFARQLVSPFLLPAAAPVLEGAPERGYLTTRSGSDASTELQLFLTEQQLVEEARPELSGAALPAEQQHRSVDLGRVLGRELREQAVDGRRDLGLERPGILHDSGSCRHRHRLEGAGADHPVEERACRPLRGLASKRRRAGKSA